MAAWERARGRRAQAEAEPLPGRRFAWKGTSRRNTEAKVIGDERQPLFFYIAATVRKTKGKLFYILFLRWYVTFPDDNIFSHICPDEICVECLFLLYRNTIISKINNLNQITGNAIEMMIRHSVKLIGKFLQVFIYHCSKALWLRMNSI